MHDDPKDGQIFNPDEVADHESGLRRLVAHAGGEVYEALLSLAEAQAAPDGVVVLEGDYGGQIYVVAPSTLVRCSEGALQDLLADIDAREWADPDGARVYYERRAVGAGIAGGMGGGLVIDGIWVHPELSVASAAVVDVLAGRWAR